MGAGSALYGAGVDSGVIHYISKDPFSYPGAVLTVAGGSAFSSQHSGESSGSSWGQAGIKAAGQLR